MIDNFGSNGSFYSHEAHGSQKRKCTPDWTSEAKSRVHLWCRTSISGDFCFISAEDNCARHGPRYKCSSCKIVTHEECIETTANTVSCRATFEDAGVALQREKTEVNHHWIPRRSQKGKCQRCGKSFTSKLPFGGKDSMAMSCTWCKMAFHNKKSCFTEERKKENCSLGNHANIIVPPTWIVKLPIQEGEISPRFFAVKPIPSSSSKPLLVFINPKSGGNQGSKLMRTFQWLLNPRQVFDLSEEGPKLGLQMFRKVPNLRILACGGDGTVGWILSVLDELKVTPTPPIAVLPLGTGNDLARTLGWGGGYTDEPITKILTNVEDGEIVKLDRWMVKITANIKVDPSTCEAGRSDLPMNVVNNYFSIGVDALIALEFHEAREAHPEKFNSRFWNKMFYGQAGGKDLIQRKWKHLCNFVTLECDGQDMTHKLKELKVHSILFLNISNYGGGTMPWGNPVGKQFQTPTTDDGKIEVIGLTTYQLPLLQAGGHGSAITQCKSAKLVTKRTVPVQVDGEPCRLLPSVIEIDRLNTVCMVANTKRHGRSQKEVNIEKLSIDVKRINMRDYEAHHHHKKVLKDKATSLGTLNISIDTVLADIKANVVTLLFEVQIKLQGETKETPPVTSEESKKEENATKKETDQPCEWWFLDSCTEDKFYRIDHAQEQLYYAADISDENLYIVSETIGTDIDETSISITNNSQNGIQPLAGEDDEGIDTDDASGESMTSSLSVRSLASAVSGFSATNSVRDTRKLSTASDVCTEGVIGAATMGNVIKLARLHMDGQDMMVRDVEGRTALHHAAFIGNTEVVKYLAFYGPKQLLDVQDDIMYQTALHRAATRGDRATCSVLVCAGCSPGILDKQGLTAHHLADMIGDKVLAEYLETMENPVVV